MPPPKKTYRNVLRSYVGRVYTKDMTNTQTFTAEQNETFAANWNAKAEAAHKAGNTEFARSCWAEWETFHDAAQEARTAERAERFSGDTTSAWENQTR